MRRALIIAAASVPSLIIGAISGAVFVVTQYERLRDDAMRAQRCPLCDRVDCYPSEH